MARGSARRKSTYAIMSTLLIRHLLMSERQGQKRWDKATVTGYESVRRLAHENLLPASERLNVVLSRLRGLSKFQVSNVSLGLSTQEIDSVIDTVNALQLAAHHVLIASGAELHQFLAFSSWLRQEIDTQSADPSTPEVSEKEINVDHASALEYIRGPMMKSRLLKFFDLQAQSNQRSRRDLAAEGRSLFELYKRELGSIGKEDSPARQLPSLDALISHLDSQCQMVFGRIAETQRRNVRFGLPISLGKGIPESVDLRMLVEVKRSYQDMFERYTDVQCQKNARKKDTFALYVIAGPTSRQAFSKLSESYELQSHC